MNYLEAKKISERSMGDPFIISLERLYSFINEQAHLGFVNCTLSIAPENLENFLSDLKKNGYDVSHEDLKNNNIENNLFSRYSRYSTRFIQLEISWF
jgi:hypothetical protein